ncbi:hypothetical protein [Thiohalobacter thiocyanaticus]|uniref:hypothetical protein n=1 Tax=Thiohalobacter thiocyanaticus TaxID=585455 RepID=UPI001F4E36DA|nr:hypothetical protein [Thiohalobacter thiocyanaticus]
MFNTARIEALELENLMDVALATVCSALERRESRGAHSRIDYPERDDTQWLRHSLFYKQDQRVDFKGRCVIKPRAWTPSPPTGASYDEIFHYRLQSGHRPPAYMQDFECRPGPRPDVLLDALLA